MSAGPSRMSDSSLNGLRTNDFQKVGSASSAGGPGCSVTGAGKRHLRNVARQGDIRLAAGAWPASGETCDRHSHVVRVSARADYRPPQRSAVHDCS